MTFATAASPRAGVKGSIWHVVRVDRHTVCGRDTKNMRQADAVPPGGKPCASCDRMKESMARELAP